MKIKMMNNTTKINAVEATIQKEIAAYNNSVVAIPPPPFLIELLKKAVRVTPIQKRKYSPEILVAIVEKQTKELTNIEARICVNIIVEADPQTLYRDFKDQMIKETKVLTFINKMNIETMQIEKEYSEKKKRMIQLS